MTNKPLPDDFHEDLQWEIEADKSWDAFYLAHGIDRQEAIRMALSQIHYSRWHRIKTFFWNLYFAIHPPDKWR